MESYSSEQNSAVSAAPADRPVPPACPSCHQPVLPTYYFCPNCGANLRPAPLKTDTISQIELYLFSIVLPMIAFLAVGKWQGLKYLKSKDPKEKQIGMIAWALMIISTIIVIWYTVVWTQNYIQETVNSINVDLGSLGN